MDGETMEEASIKLRSRMIDMRQCGVTVSDPATQLYSVVHDPMLGVAATTRLVKPQRLTRPGPGTLAHCQDLETKMLLH